MPLSIALCAWVSLGALSPVPTAATRAASAALSASTLASASIALPASIVPRGSIVPSASIAQTPTAGTTTAQTTTVQPPAVQTSAAQTPAAADGTTRRMDAASALSVDGEPISLDEYEAWLLRRCGEDEAPFYCTQLVLEAEARRLGLVVDDFAIGAHVDREIDERIRGAHAGKKEAWLAELAASDRTETGYRLQRRMDLRLDALSDAIARATRVVTKELVQREFERRYGTSGRYLRVQMLRVDVKFPPPAPGVSGEELVAERKRIVQQTRQRADLYRTQIQNGEPFAELAKEHSDDAATREKGGVMDEPLLLDAWPQNFVMTVIFLQPGDLSPVVRVDNSFYLMRVLESKSIEIEAERERIVAEVRGAPADAQEISAVRERLAGDLAPQFLPALWARPTAGAKLDPAEAVLRFRDVDIPRHGYGAWLRARLGESRAREFATEHALQVAARARGIALTPADLDARVDAEMERVLREDFGGRRDRLEREILRRYRDTEHWRHDLRAQVETMLPVERLLLARRVVSDADVRGLWEQRYGPLGEGLVARWILLAPAPVPAEDPPPTPEQAAAAAEARKDALRRTANDIVSRARAGADFAALALEHSAHEPTRGDGGRLPYHVVPQRLAPERRAALDALQAGGVSEPLPEGEGFAIYKLEARERIELAKVEAELRRELAERTPDRIEVASELHRIGTSAKIEYGAALLR